MLEIINYMEELFPNPKCELNYKKDYELLIAVMLSAQATDKRVNEVTKVLFDKYKTIDKLASADKNDIINIIKPIGTYNKKSENVIKIAQAIKEIGKVPNDRVFLESLDGVGRKTTNVVLSNIYSEPYMAVDTHVSRVSKRLGLVDDDDDVLTIEKKLTKKIPSTKIPNMHHQLVLFGRYYCKAIKPICTNCKLKHICKYEKKNSL